MLKFSFVFYLCVMLVLYVAGWIVYSFVIAIGAVDRITRLMIELGMVDRGFRINGGWLASRALFVGLVMVVLWSLINVLVAFLYNLISRLVGGVEVTLTERR